MSRLARLARVLPLALIYWLGIGAEAHAGPVFAAIATWVATSLPFVSAAVDTIVYFAVQAVLYVGTSYAVSKLAAPNQRGAGQERQASVVQLSLGETARELLVGEVATAGSLVDGFDYGGTYETDKEVLVLQLADHRCDDLVGYYIGDSYFDFAGDGVQPGFNNQLEVYWHDGQLAQAADGILTANSGRWTSSDRLAGCAYVVVVYKADDPKQASPVWSTGRPAFLWRVKGARFYDARKDSTVAGGSGAHRWDDPATREWSDNAAVVRYNYLRGIFAGDQVDQPDQLLIGRGLTEVEAPPERMIAYANTCDEDVALLAGGTEKRYRVNGAIRADEPFDRVDEMFAAAMAGTMVQREGGVEVEPGVAKSTVAAIGDADLLAGFPFQADGFLSDDDRVNSISPRYVEPLQIWRDTAAPIRRAHADITADGGPKSKDLTLSLVTSQTQAQRCGEIERRLARKERRCQVALGGRFSHLEEGDWITGAFARFNGATITWRVEAHAEDAGLRVGLVLREIAASCFDWDETVDEGVPGQAPVDEPADLAPLALAGVTIVAFSFAGSDGTVTPGVKATWSTPVDKALAGVRLEVRKVGTTDVDVGFQPDPNQGVLAKPIGYAATSAEARVVPLGTDGRRLTASAWTAITTAAISLPDLVAAISDGVLTVVEKRTFVPTINALVAARTNLRTQATAYGLTTVTSTQRAAFETAATNLDNYLATLTSAVAWNNFTGATTIASPSTFRTRLEDALKTERDLQTAIDTAGKALTDTALSDGVLTIAEKRNVVPPIKALLAAATNLQAQATLLSLPSGGGTPKANHSTAVSNWNSYASALTSPVAWDNFTDTTTIASPSTFRTRLQDLVNTQTELQTAIGNKFNGRTQLIDDSGRLTTIEGLPGINVPGGFGFTFSTYPLTSDGTHIYLASVTMEWEGGSRVLPSATLGGLSPSRIYSIVFQWVGNFWGAIDPVSVDAFIQSADRWLYLGDYPTTNGGAVYPSPNLPAGYVGGPTGGRYNIDQP